MQTLQRVPVFPAGASFGRRQELLHLESAVQPTRFLQMSAVLDVREAKTL